MLDIGFWEMIVIGVVVLIVVQPNDLPGFLRRVGSYISHIKTIGAEFRTSLAVAANSIEDAKIESEGSSANNSIMHPKQENELSDQSFPSDNKHKEKLDISTPEQQNETESVVDLDDATKTKV